MRRLVSFSFVCFLALGQVATNALADTLTIGDSRYLGHIVDGIPPAQQLTYLNDLLSLALGSTNVVIGTETYTRSNNNCGGLCPQGTTVASGTQTVTDVGTGIDVTGWTYLLGKYDGPDAGSHVWYVGGLTSADIPTKVPKISDPTKTVGISNIFRAGKVPDGGTTLMLLSGALFGLETLRRKFRG
jgi:hypothetical protein